ncbi:MAG: MotA/TolQ/ExbB proton channel family protein [Gammaproteobacteria bacterium]|nr:MotA/TolQ/ExbB proton channel family protein [Gammaproteobacteria bacterium]
MSTLLSDFLEFTNAGGYVMLPLVGLTCILWFAIGCRYWLLRRGTRRSVRALLDINRDGWSGQQRGMIDYAVKSGIDLKQQFLSGKFGYQPNTFRKLLDSQIYPYEQAIRQYAVIIKAVVIVAPLLGLLGTVSGMIETFDSLGDMALFTQSGGIAGGISQALFTTQMGLVVAIPGALIQGMLNRRQLSLEMELAQIKDLLCVDISQSNPSVD